ncbi:ABC transporter ATP-binding protein [Ruminococcaceae bacterium OttesenSCG-928-I18]|nr:ABC transporter ATP-binding protein [Ruminococcaceae bacterium OttesenSCG-928-I18]
MSMIEVRGLTKDYKKGRGIFDLHFSVEQGEVFGYLGPNGAGKTTTIRHLMGFLNPDAGRCRIAKMDCRKRADAVQKRLGYIPGEIAFPGDMTGTAFLRFMAKYRGMQGAGRRDELLERFELDPSGKLRKMSKGMKQKVGIVCAFQHDPAVLILDEPTSGLDPLMQNRFVQLLLEEKQRGKTILMSSHMFEEIERTCERVAIIRKGRLVAVESIETLKAAQTQRYIITFASPEAAEAFCGEALEIEARQSHRVTVLTHGELSALLAAMVNYPVTAIETPNQGLEEVFMNYYGGQGA